MARHIQFEPLNLSDEFKAYSVSAKGNIDYLNMIASIVFNEKWAVPMTSRDEMQLYAISTTIPKTESLSFDDLMDIASDLRIRSKSEFDAARPKIIARYRRNNPDSEIPDNEIIAPLESMISGLITYGLRMEVMSKFAMRPWDRLVANPANYTYTDFGIQKILELIDDLNNLTEMVLGSSATSIIEGQVETLINKNKSLAFLYNLVYAMESKSVALAHVAPVFIMNDMFDNHDFATTQLKKRSLLKLKRGTDLYEFGRVECGVESPLDGVNIGDIMTYIELFENCFVFNRDADAIMSANIDTFLKETTHIDIDNLIKLMKEKTVTGSVVFSESIDKLDKRIAELAWLLALRMVMTSQVPESKIDVRYLVESYRLDRAVTLSLSRTFNVIECMIKAYICAFKIMVSPIKAMLADSNYQKSYNLSAGDLFPDLGKVSLGYTPDYIPIIVAWNEADFNVSANKMVKKYKRYREGRMRELEKTTSNRSFNRDILRPYDDLTWIESLSADIELDRYFNYDYVPDKDDVLLTTLSELSLKDYYVSQDGDKGWKYLSRGITDAEVRQIVRTNTDIKPRNLYDIFDVEDIATITNKRRNLNVVFREMEELFSPFELYYLERRNMLNKFIPSDTFDKMDEDIRSQVRLSGYELLWVEDANYLLKLMGLAGTVDDFKAHFPAYHKRFFDKSGNLISNKVMILREPELLDRFRVITSEHLTKDIDWDVLRHEVQAYGFASPIGRYYKPNRLYKAEVEILANVHRPSIKPDDIMSKPEDVKDMKKKKDRGKNKDKETKEESTTEKEGTVDTKEEEKDDK